MVFFFQAEDGIRDLVRSRGLGDVYKRQGIPCKGCQPRELKHLSTWRKRKQVVIPLVVASEEGTVQTLSLIHI